MIDVEPMSLEEARSYIGRKMKMTLRDGRRIIAELKSVDVDENGKFIVHFHAPEQIDHIEIKGKITV